MTRETYPCVVCGKELRNIDDFPGNQPYAGTTFLTYGHYGSTIFDPMDGSYLEINVCDECLRRFADEGKVFLGRTSKPPRPRRLVPWHPGLEEGS